MEPYQHYVCVCVCVCVCAQWQSPDGATMLPTDMALRVDPEYLAIVQEFASDNNAFIRAFAGAWTKMMNADRFSKGRNVCSNA